jgi:aminopeptidase N
MKKLLFFLLALPIFWSCSPKQYSPILLPETEYRDLDTLTVTAPKPDNLREDGGSEEQEVANELPDYNPSAKRDNDLLHTKLDLRFDWQKEQVLGKATLHLKPFFYPTDKVVLDAKGFVFHKITMEGSGQELKHDYDGKQLTVYLGKTYNRNQEYKLFIDYTATPSESGGSAAITSDKGLFFINPRGEEGDKPQQIWTQGETENNSRWFPTIDKPNERCTQEMYLTVEDRFKTLSNGILVSSKKNNDGTRTDYWKMDMPHAPYLFMVAVGDYAVVKDKWRGKDVDYYVEPKFEKYARTIFPHTPEMLSFFSDQLGMEYPWQKYSQVVVRDYVSGAMENTTAVIFGEFMQASDRELMDNLQNDKIVAHEMFHHWFGDYVTCESWANLTLNEGFANYSEYLWLEHKYGRDEADFHRLQEMQGYLQSAQGGIHPLVHFGYEDKENMFDAHSYNKGGLVLHMLRSYVGDEAFFAALNKYLKDNALSDVEGHELRLAFEDLTGEDLNWFFNQWFYSQGHPDLKVEYDYDPDKQAVIVVVEQRQNPENMPPIFQLPVAIDVYEKGEMKRHEVTINQRKQTFSFPATTDPDLIVFDGEGNLLATVEEEKSLDEYMYQYEHASNFLHRVKALGEIADSQDPRAEDLLKKALNDKFWLLRLVALEGVSLEGGSIGGKVATMAEKDPHSSVRETALARLGATEDKQYAPVAIKAIENDKSIKVVSAGLNALLQLDEAAAMAAAAKLENETDQGIIMALATMYSDKGDIAKLPYFEKNFDNISGFGQYSYIEAYAALATKGDAASMLTAAEKMKKVAMNDANFFWMRYMATKSINDLHAAISNNIEEESDASKKAEMEAKDAKIIAMLQEIKAWETDARIKNMYQNFPDPALKP